MKHIKREMLEEFLQKAGRPSACLETFQSLKPFAGSKNAYEYIWQYDVNVTMCLDFPCYFRLKKSSLSG